ncbi:MAG: patatin-like phospholipase family protein [bacterium]
MKKVGLVLGSGVAKGLAHIGVLKAIDKQKIPIDFIAGTSIGALIGAMYASGISGEEIEEIALNIDIKKTLALFTPTMSYSGLIDGQRVINFIESIIGRQNIEDLRIPFAAISSNIVTGEEIVITKGSLLNALRASISIPGIFTPVEYNQKLLVDGGLVNPVPVSAVLKMGADIVIAVNVLSAPQKNMRSYIRMDDKTKKTPAKKSNSQIINTRLGNFAASLKPVAQFSNFVKKKTSTPSIFHVLLQTISVTEYEIANFQLAKHKPDFLITPAVEFVAPLEFFRAKEAILEGEKAFSAVIPSQLTL